MELLIWFVQKFLVFVYLSACSILGLLVYATWLVRSLLWLQTRQPPTPLDTPQPMEVLAQIGILLRWSLLEEVARNVEGWMADSGVHAFLYWTALVVIAVGIVIYTVVRTMERTRVLEALALPIAALATLAQLNLPVIPVSLGFIGGVVILNVLRAALGAERAHDWNRQSGAKTAVAEIASWSRHLLADLGAALVIAPVLAAGALFLPGSRAIRTYA